MRISIWMVLVGLGVVISSAAVQADVILQHSGKTNPTTEGFSLHGGGGSGVTDTSVSPSVDAWNITGGMNRYVADLSADADTLANGFVASMKVRDALTPDSATDFGIYFEVSLQPTGQGSKSITLLVGSDSSGNPVLYQSTPAGSTTSQITLSGITGSGYHDYQLLFDASVSTTYAKLYVDGTYQADITPTDNNSEWGVTSRFVWGSSDGAAVADAYWASASLSTIPEPSSMLLFVTGCFGLLAYAWRKRK